MKYRPPVASYAGRRRPPKRQDYGEVDSVDVSIEESIGKSFNMWTKLPRRTHKNGRFLKGQLSLKLQKARTDYKCGFELRCGLLDGDAGVVLCLFRQHSAGEYCICMLAPLMLSTRCLDATN